MAQRFATEPNADVYVVEGQPNLGAVTCAGDPPRDCLYDQRPHFFLLIEREHSRCGDPLEIEEVLQAAPTMAKARREPTLPA